MPIILDVFDSVDKFETKIELTDVVVSREGRKPYHMIDEVLVAWDDGYSFAIAISVRR